MDRYGRKNKEEGQEKKKRKRMNKVEKEIGGRIINEMEKEKRRE